MDSLIGRDANRRPVDIELVTEAVHAALHVGLVHYIWKFILLIKLDINNIKIERNS